MKNIGVLAAMTISVLGPVSDVCFFFNFIVGFLESGIRGSKYKVITTRLYSGSILREELIDLKLRLDCLEEELKSIRLENVDLKSFGFIEECSRLSFHGVTMFDVFCRFFKVLNEAIKCSDVFFKEFGEYVPLRLGFTDMPDYIFDIKRSADLYNSLSVSDIPFWMR